MKKTLLLVFIHGFKGGDDTFEQFPEHLRSLIADELPKISVLTAIYPRYETRGELTECVSRFKEWLQNKVIDLEVAIGTPSPTVDPGVRVILVGHSMGGIVAAETLLSIAKEEPVPAQDGGSTRPTHNRTNSSTQSNSTTAESTARANLTVPNPEVRAASAPPDADNSSPSANQERPDPPTAPHAASPLPSFLFPFVQGILAFDTPYLGIHPGVVAHGAESHYNTATAAVQAYNSATKFFGFGAQGAAPVANSSRALPSAGQAAQASGGGWGRLALYAGGAAALAAAGSAAYMNRGQITTGWNWVSSHLAFVGCLARGAELAQRVEAVVRLEDKHGVGFADFYTRLGKAEGSTKVAGQLLGEERTFCVVPTEAKAKKNQGEESPAKRRKTSVESKKHMKGTWIEAVNSKSDNEITAHRAIFTPRDHPEYYTMSEKAKQLAVGWVDRSWYNGSTDDSSPEKSDAFGGA